MLIFLDRLSVQTTVVSGTIWPQSVMQVLTGGSEPPGMWAPSLASNYRGVGDGSRE